MALTNEQFDQWVAALRSGDYEQGENCLGHGNEYGGYCCLGVLCALNGVDMNTYGYMTGVDECEIPQGSGLERITNSQRNALAKKNDTGYSFRDIADYLEAHRDEYTG